jgi:hypothetical protein
MSILGTNSSRGLFVDHTSLVVRLSDHEFPNRCIKTGLAATTRHRQDFIRFLWAAKYSPIVALLRIALLILGLLIAPRFAIRDAEYYRNKHTKQLRFSIEYSLSPDWTSAEKHRNRRAVWLILAGVAVILVGMVVSVPTDWGLAIVLLGALISIVGPAVTAVRISDEPLVLIKLRGEFAWFRGCDKDFLFGLPPYVSSGHMSAA